MKSESTPSASLADRIALALREEVSSAEIADLIKDSKDARVAAEKAHEAAYSRALDPTANTERASAGKREADDLRFEMDRLDAALEALEGARKGAKAREENARRRAAYEAAKAERDALARELREIYPAVERQLSDLVRRVAFNDAELDVVNRNRPAGAAGLASAEEVARGGREKFGTAQEYLGYRITARLRLPKFEIDPLRPFAWPNSHT
jgi:hypothetical protein